MNSLAKLLSAFLAAAAIASCVRFDNSEIKSELSDIRDRLTALEEKAGGDVSGLWEIVNALSNSVTINSVSETDDGWVLRFSDGRVATLGKAGAAGTPALGAKQDTDGVYYWTLDGQWLLGEDGKKLPVTGSDGAPGVAPQLKIDEGLWYLSTDGGNTWTMLGKATGEDGDAFFKEVTWDDESVYVTMADGSSFELPRGFGLVASIAVIPDYIDGTVKAGTGPFTIRFKVAPESAAESILRLSIDCFTLSAVYMLTKGAEAGELTSLPIHEMEAADGILTIVTDGYGLAGEFAGGTLGVCASLFISDGASLSVNTGYFPLRPSNEYLGHKYVDLGLESGNKFANANFGAAGPEDTGVYIAWGEREAKEDYSWNSYLWCNGTESTITKYNDTDGLASFGDNAYTDDVVRQEWGGEWRTPTREDWEELMDGSKFKWVWTSRNGKSGYEVTSRNDDYAGQSLFLPATGALTGAELQDKNAGYYWSSTRSTSPSSACGLYVSSDKFYLGDMFRSSGFAIRPVLGKYEKQEIKSRRRQAACGI